MASVLNNLFGGKSTATPDPTQGAADGTHALFASPSRCTSISLSLCSLARAQLPLAISHH